jgi:Domain of unknown function (DUF1707)
MTCGSGLRRTGWTLSIGLRIRRSGGGRPERSCATLSVHRPGGEAPGTAWSGDEIAAGPAGHRHLRASNADREQVIDMLKAAFVQGRLTRDELDLRVGQALKSRTYAEQAAVIADLPAGLIAAGQPGSRARRTRSRARGNAEVRTGLRVISVSTVLAALFWVIAIVARDSEAAFIGAVWTTGVVLAVSALTGSAALGSWLDKRRGSQPPHRLAGGQASQLPASAASAAQMRRRGPVAASMPAGPATWISNGRSIARTVQSAGGPRCWLPAWSS